MPLQLRVFNVNRRQQKCLSRYHTSLVLLFVMFTCSLQLAACSRHHNTSSWAALIQIILTYLSTTANNLMSREIVAGAGGGCKKNDGWDMDYYLSNRKITGVSAFLETTTSSKPLDNFLSGQHDHNFPFELTLSIPASSKDDNENDEDDRSVISEMTMMTYRAEATKKVSNKKWSPRDDKYVYPLDLRTTTANS